MKLPRLLRPLTLALALMTTFASSACAAVPKAAEPDWTNPLIRQRADPWVYRHTDGQYYFTASVPAYDRIELRRAPTLAGLSTATPVTAWKKHDKGPASHHIWAPELHYIQGKWYIYFAAGRAEDIWAIRIYVLENSNPNPLEGTWRECGQLKTHLESFSLDATSFEHKGVRYLVWAQHDPAIGGNTNLYIAELEKPWAIKGTPVLITKPEHPWETVGFRVNEGPAALIRNGRIFLTFSASATDSNYCMGLLTASAEANLLDPASWKKTPQPVLATTPTAKLFGPGHNSFTQLPDGTDVLVFHARDYKDIKGDPLYDPNRHTMATRIEWAADGSPVFRTAP